VFHRQQSAQVLASITNTQQRRMTEDGTRQSAAITSTCINQYTFAA